MNLAIISSILSLNCAASYIISISFGVMCVGLFLRGYSVVIVVDL